MAAKYDLYVFLEDKKTKKIATVEGDLPRTGEIFVNYSTDPTVLGGSREYMIVLTIEHPFKDHNIPIEPNQPLVLETPRVVLGKLEKIPDFTTVKTY